MTVYLFNFRFVENDMLAHDRVILAEGQFFRLLFGVLFSDVIKARIRGAYQLNQYNVLLGHDTILKILRGE
jgi:hypothetical protein